MRPSARPRLATMKLTSLLNISLAAAGASATTGLCNPLNTTCTPDPALAATFKEDFTTELPYFYAVQPNAVSYSSSGAKLTLAEASDLPILQSHFYIMFGKVEVVLKAAPGQGVILAFFLQSDDLDEIDIEFSGSNTAQFQSNFFSKGNTATYDRGEYHDTSSNPLENFHTYTLDWNKDGLTWALDGMVVRSLLSGNSEGYPQTPMYLRTGVWVPGNSDQGTVEWAGGAADMSKGPYSMYIKSLIVTDYSTGTSYSYQGKSGSWESIQSDCGLVNGRQLQAMEEFGKCQEQLFLETTATQTKEKKTKTKGVPGVVTVTTVTTTTPGKNTVATTEVLQTVPTTFTTEAFETVPTTVTTQAVQTVVETPSDPTANLGLYTPYTQTGPVTQQIDSNQKALVSFNGNVGAFTLPAFSGAGVTSTTEAPNLVSVHSTVTFTSTKTANIGSSGSSNVWMSVVVPLLGFFLW